MKWLLLSTFLLFGYSFAFTQSNTIIVGGQIGGTPYLATTPFAKGFHIQYNRTISKKWILGVAVGKIVKDHTHIRTVRSTRNGETFKTSYQFDDSEKSTYFEMDLSYQLINISRYHLHLGLGATFLSNNFNYSENIKLIKYEIQSIKLSNAKKNVVMMNLAIGNEFRINQHFVLSFKSIIRGQFHSQYRVHRIITNIDSGSSSSDQPLALTASYSLILGVGYRF